MALRIRNLLRTITSSYHEDDLFTLNHAPFVNDPRFNAAYRRGDRASPDHTGWRWRVHVGLWAASLSAQLDGDFVECGVNRGFLSSAIMEHLDWNSLDKHFHLFDSFAGVKDDLLTLGEIQQGRLEAYDRAKRAGEVALDVEEVRQNFSSWQRVTIIPGFVPDTLGQATVEKVAFLHLDMNCALPEYEAGRFFWNRIVDGGVILMDDYCNSGFPDQHRILAQLATEVGASILALPTGQGVLIK